MFHFCFRCPVPGALSSVPDVHLIFFISIKMKITSVKERALHNACQMTQVAPVLFLFVLSISILFAYIDIGHRSRIWARTTLIEHFDTLQLAEHNIL